MSAMIAVALSFLSTYYVLFLTTGISLLVGLLYVVLRPTPAPVSVEPLTKEQLGLLLSCAGFRVQDKWFSIVGMDQIHDSCAHMSPILVQDDDGNEVEHGGFANDMKNIITEAKERLSKQTSMCKNCLVPISNRLHGIKTTVQTLVDGKTTSVTKNILMVYGYGDWMAFTLIPDVVVFVQCSWQVSPDDLKDDYIYDLSKKDVIVQSVAYDPKDTEVLQDAYDLAFCVQSTFNKTFPAE